MASVLEVGEIVPPELRIGETIADDRYRLLGHLSSTPHSMVFEALDQQDESIVVIKEFNEHTDTARSRVDMEIATHIALNGEVNIAPLHVPEAVIDAPTGQRSLVLELATGGCLDGITREHPLDIDSVISMTASIIPAVEIVHENRLLHCDIKPGNILTDRSRTQWWLTDFGIVELLGSTASPRIYNAIHELGVAAPPQSQTSDYTRSGTAGFMAPERGRAGKVSRPADIYSLGATMYAAATRRLPHPEHNFKSYVEVASSRLPLPMRWFDSSIPAAFDSLVMSCLEPEPCNRPLLGDVANELLTL